MFKKFIVVSVVALALLAAGLHLFSKRMTAYGSRAVAPNDQSEILLTVAPGEGFSAVSEALLKKGLIESPVKFKILARMQGADKHIKAGEYGFTRSMAPRKILADMVAGKVRLRKFTIPEGYTLVQIAQVVEKAGFGDAQRFLALTDSPRAAAALGIRAPSLEGYLFPDTYYFAKSASVKTVVNAMVDRFKKIYTPKMAGQAKKIGLTTHEVLTLAAIIEKETGAPEERPVIASVFHNRLKRGMPLQSDPTVIYGIKDFDGNITRKDLKTPQPFNTYAIPGLPPGPIAAPGLAAIRAALYPADTQFFYFVSKNDGTHHFSATLAEHNRAVRKYQLRR